MNIQEAITQRFSPRKFKDKPVSKDDMADLMEAIRLAPSCFNEQPWKVFYANKNEHPEFYQELLGILTEGNQTWAKHAPLLMVNAVDTTFARNGKTNTWAGHDLGLAMGQMALLATEKGISVHQMGGFIADKAREVLNLPDHWKPITAVAVGYADEQAVAKNRKPLSEMVFTKAYSQYENTTV